MPAHQPSSLPAIVLASGSVYRRDMLRRLVPHFEVIPPDVDETPRPGESCAALAERLAAAKARAIAVRRPAALVIGGDQVAELAGQPLGKPATAARAQQQLLACSGQILTLHTAACIIAPGEAAVCAHRDETRLSFRELTPAMAARYVARDRPLDCAGGFRFEAAGIALFSRVETSDPSAIQGLPLIWLTDCLASLGVPIP